VTKSEALDLQYIQVPISRLFGKKNGMFQRGLLKYMLREKPDAIKMFANPRYLSFWTTAFAARLLGIPFYAHGVAFYKKQRIGLVRRLMMQSILRLVTSYIAYAPIVRESLAAQGFCVNKVFVVANSLLNRFAVPPSEKTGKERGILFVGRLRRGSGLSLLLQVIQGLKQEGNFPCTLHVVGDGEEAESLRQQAGGCDWIVWHGEAYGAQVSNISRQCLFGCYPGNAGLSVVHMMSLSLPVIIHDDLSSHEGPEPSYIRDGLTGVLYDHKDPQRSLANSLQRLVAVPDQVRMMQRSCFEEYQRLTHPSYAEKLWAIMAGTNIPARESLSAANP
jgi:glycosyltransferase involved in cell wall biosynthesis